MESKELEETIKEIKIELLRTFGEPRIKFEYDILDSVNDAVSKINLEHPDYNNNIIVFCIMTQIIATLPERYCNEIKKDYNSIASDVLLSKFKLNDNERFKVLGILKEHHKEILDNIIDEMNKNSYAECIPDPYKYINFYYIPYGDMYIGYKYYFSHFGDFKEVYKSLDKGYIEYLNDMLNRLFEMNNYNFESKASYNYKISDLEMAKHMISYGPEYYMYNTKQISDEQIKEIVNGK